MVSIFFYLLCMFIILLHIIFWNYVVFVYPLNDLLKRKAVHKFCSLRVQSIIESLVETQIIFLIWTLKIFLSKSSSVQLLSRVPDSLQPHGLQQARLPCPSSTPGGCSNSCPASPWCHLAISSSVIPFSSCLQSFPTSGSFPMSQFFASGGQSIGVSASASVLPMNIQDGLVGSPCSPRVSQESSPTPQFKSINFSAFSFLHSPTLASIHDNWKNHSFD